MSSPDNDEGPTRAPAAPGLALPRVSVIVPVYNDVVRLRRCLAALARQSYPADRYDVLVVDNGSTEDLAPAVPDVAGFRLLREERPGSYAARNTGLAATDAELLAFTDSDCLPMDDWLEAGVRALTVDPTVDAVGGRILLTFRSGGPVSPAEHFEAVTGFPQERYVREMSFAATANLFVRRAALDRVGPFDEQLKSGGDVEFGKRLTAGGGRLRYDAGPVVEHPARHTWGQLRIKTVRVAQGVSDRTGGLDRAGTLRRAARDLRSAATVWLRVWTMPQPDRAAARLRYAAAFSYVRLLRVRVYLLSDLFARRAGRPASRAQR